MNWGLNVVEQIEYIDNVNVYKKYMDPEEDGGEIQIRYLIKCIKKA